MPLGWCHPRPCLFIHYNAISILPAVKHFSHHASDSMLNQKTYLKRKREKNLKSRKMLSQSFHHKTRYPNSCSAILLRSPRPPWRVCLCLIIDCLPRPFFVLSLNSFTQTRTWKHWINRSLTLSVFKTPQPSLHG